MNVCKARIMIAMMSTVYVGIMTVVLLVNASKASVEMERHVSVSETQIYMRSECVIIRWMYIHSTPNS
jgi:hypothetical protein